MPRIVQTGSSIYLQGQGLVILSHKEPEEDTIDVFIVQENEYFKQPNPYKANVINKYTFSAREVTVDDTLEQIIEKYVTR